MRKAQTTRNRLEFGECLVPAKVTNDLGLLEPIYKALAHDAYTSGGADITPTAWIDSPRIAQLMKTHRDEIEESVSDRVFSALGTGFHNIMENAVGDNAITEERVFLDHPSGLRVSGAIDLQIEKEDGTTILVDYKVTGVYGVILNKKNGGVKPEWEKQLNSYRYLLQRAKDIKVSELYILTMLRDGKSSEVGKPDYPVAPVMQIPVPLWSWQDTVEYVDERISLHREASYSSLIGEELPLCTSEEMWERPEKFAVMKSSTHKRASRLLNSMEEAIEWAADPTNGMDSKHVIEHRQGKRVRCEDWCKVAPFCSQYKEYVERANDDI